MDVKAANILVDTDGMKKIYIYIEREGVSYLASRNRIRDDCVVRYDLTACLPKRSLMCWFDSWLACSSRKRNFCLKFLTHSHILQVIANSLILVLVIALVISAKG